MLFGQAPASFNLADLTRESGPGARHSPVQRELKRLMAEGLVRRRPSHGRQGTRYMADPSAHGYLELRRLVLVTTGLGARIGEVVDRIDPHALVWLHGPYTEEAAPLIAPRVVALTAEARQVRRQLQALEMEPGRRLILDVMSTDEWSFRVERREMRALAIRRSQRLWLRGDGNALRRAERWSTDSRRSAREAIRNWREELSDEWDEDFDPDAPVDRF